jgi:hypothetical protein
VENVFEALDSPGEWYLDRPAGKVYYIPKAGQTPANTVIVAPHLPSLVRMIGSEDNTVHDIHFSGLTFSHVDWRFPKDDAGSVQAAWEVPGAFYFEHADSCSLLHCNVNHVSTYAVEVGNGSENIRIENCELTDLGAGGVKLGHHSNHGIVHNCEIGPGGHIYHSAIGTYIGHSSENMVTHNHIHHFYYSGVSVGWSWGYKPSAAVRNIIEFNHIHHIGQGLLSDMGGIYTLGVSPNTRLRYNLIHDVEAHTYGGWGLYNDEGSTHIMLENNIVYNTKHAGYHQHYGKENYIRNNIFAYGREAQVMRTRQEEHDSFVFERNIINFETPTLLGSNWSNDKFQMDYNIYWRVGGKPFDFKGASFEEWQARGHDQHSYIADPLFADPANGNFTFTSTEVADRIGFVPIDTSRIGRLKDQ